MNHKPTQFRSGPCCDNSATRASFMQDGTSPKKRTVNETTAESKSDTVIYDEITGTQENSSIQVYLIEGMDCASCAEALKKHVRHELGIRDVSINFHTAKMKLAYDGPVETVVRVVERAGYRAVPADTSGRVSRQAEADSRWIIPNLRTTALSGLFLLTGYLLSFLHADSTAQLAAPFYVLAMLVAGGKAARNAWYALKSRSLDMNVLMTLAAAGAAAIGEWAEGATVVFLFALGSALQSGSISRTRQSIRKLMQLAPADASVWTAQGWQRRKVNNIVPGEIILVKPGERIPLDGVVTRGSSDVNQAPLTGESLPVEKRPGDEVYAGTVNESGVLEVKVTKPASAAMISRIVHLVEEAQENKAPTEQLVDRFARLYTPVVVAFSAAVISIPSLVTGDWETWFYRGLELLVIACPCALVISTPVAVVSAIGHAAKQGVLIKGGAALETAGRLTHVAFDKTGTLTRGEPQVVAVKTVGDVPLSQLLGVAAAIEEHSQHPIARAIVQYAREQGITWAEATRHQAISGKGASAVLDGTNYYAGNMCLSHELGIDLTAVQDVLTQWRQEGWSIVLIGSGRRLLGMIAAADTVRPASAETVRQLKRSGIQSVMLTGDHEGTAERVARQLGIFHFKANLLPEQKLEQIRRLKQKGTVAMIGDGINDAPALAAADLGVAMGAAGTDTAMETADVVLMADSIERLPELGSLSRQALAIIKQNIWFSISIKAIALLLILPDWLTLWIAVLSDTGAALLVIGNSMRLWKW
ncbi:MAG: cadmium-translocating P-type ATPase [Brevibacillus sp.]|nr:cadmium-translocating P-type ATPase [Brevibacillus sp.]